MLAGDDAVFAAVLRQEGALRVDSMEALMEIARVADHAARRGFPRVRAARGRLGIVTISGNTFSNCGTASTHPVELSGTADAEILPGGATSYLPTPGFYFAKLQNTAKLAVRGGASGLAVATTTLRGRTSAA